MDLFVDASRLRADAATLDALARLELALRRTGRRVRLLRVGDELRDLIVFAGLAEVLRVEPRRQAEEREQPLGSEEERQLGDAPA